MALSALQTQVTLASFQKGSLLNHSRLPRRNKTNWEGQYGGLLSSADLVAPGQIKSPALFSAASLGCPELWRWVGWIIRLGFVWNFLDALPERCASVAVLECSVKVSWQRRCRPTCTRVWLYSTIVYQQTSNAGIINMTAWSSCQKSTPWWCNRFCHRTDPRERTTRPDDDREAGWKCS